MQEPSGIDLLSPMWWLITVVVGVFIQLTVRSLDARFGRSWERVSSKLATRNRRRAAEHDRRVEGFKASSEQRIVEAITINSRLLFATISLWLGSFVFILGLMLSAPGTSQAASVSTYAVGVLALAHGFFQIFQASRDRALLNRAM